MKRYLKTLTVAGITSTLAIVLAFNPFVSAVVPGVNEIVSVSSGGTQGNQGAHSSQSVSGDGRFVAFSSGASNMVAGDTNGAWDVFVRDRTNNTTVRVSVSSSGTQGNSDSVNPRITYDGRYVVFDSHASNLISGDTNGTYDILGTILRQE